MTEKERGKEKEKAFLCGREEKLAARVARKVSAKAIKALVGIVVWSATRRRSARRGFIT